MNKLNRGGINFYRVLKGDTLKILSQRFNIPEIVLIKDNNLKKEIERGDMLIIGSYNMKIYRVKHLENINDVCKKFLMSEMEFKKINGIEYVYGGMEVFVKK